MDSPQSRPVWGWVILFVLFNVENYCDERRTMTTIAEKKHMGRVAELGCAVCRRMGYEGTPAEIHHKRAGTGAGRRATHFEVIPLCPEHHRGATGLHGLGTKGFLKHYGYDEADLLKETLQLLGS